MKLKTKKSIKKRVKVTSSGGIFLEKASRRHRLTSKSKRQKTVSRKGKAMHIAKGDLARIKKVLH